MTNRWRALHLLLLALLLRVHHLLPLSLSLLLHLFDALALCLLRCCSFRALLFLLLSPKVKHLLPSLTIAARCLSRQLSHLSLARLFSRNVRRLGWNL